MNDFDILNAPPDADGPDSPLYVLFWADGPDGFNGLASLRESSGRVVHVYYEKDETGRTRAHAGAGLKNQTVEFLDSVLGSMKNRDHNGDGILPAKYIKAMKKAWADRGLFLLVDIVGTAEKFDGGGFLYELRILKDGTVFSVGRGGADAEKMRQALNRFYMSQLAEAEN